MEKRIFSIELRANESDPNRLVGYAAVFGQRSQLLYKRFYEVIQPGAFASALGNNNDIRALWNHNPDFPLARTKNGTLRLQEDAHGLRVEIVPPDTSWGRDAMASIKRGDVDQMSFAFDVGENGQLWEQLPDGLLLRTLKDLDLSEVSPVTFPAYTGTAISARAIDLGDQPEIPLDLRGDPAEIVASLARARSETRKRRLVLHKYSLK